MDDLPAEDWESYVEDLVPPGVSQMFFFDGEKIQDIADSAASDGIRPSIRNLLGLDLIEQLRTDLTLYVARNEKDEADTDFDALQTEKADIDEAIKRAEEERAEINSRRDQVLGRVRRAEKAFANEGGRTASSREELQGFLRETNQQYERLLLELRSLAGGILPLGLSPTLVAKLKSSALAASTAQRSNAITEFIDQFQKQVNDDNSVAHWSSEHFEELKRHTERPALEMGIALDADPAFFEQRLSQIDDAATLGALELSTKLDACLLERQSLETQISGFDGGSAQALLENLKKAERENGGLEAALNSQEQIVLDLRRKKDALNAEWEKAQQRILSKAKGDRSRELAVTARTALLQYETQLLDARVESLKSHFVECFNRLIRKSGLVESVVINRETFEISLIGSDGADIPRESLSAGERQIFAVAMLWALGKTSGRALPMVIDTPFSRLDQRHRRSIIEDYLPAASHRDDARPRRVDRPLYVIGLRA